MINLQPNSIKLDRLFRKAVDILAKFPQIGKHTEIEGVRGKVVRNYMIFMKSREIHCLFGNLGYPPKSRGDGNQVIRFHLSDPRARQFGRVIRFGVGVQN